MGIGDCQRDIQSAIKRSGQGQGAGAALAQETIEISHIQRQAQVGSHARCGVTLHVVNVGAVEVFQGQGQGHAATRDIHLLQKGGHLEVSIKLRNVGGCGAAGICRVAADSTETLHINLNRLGEAEVIGTKRCFRNAANHSVVVTQEGT